MSSASPVSSAAGSVVGSVVTVLEDDDGRPLLDVAAALATLLGCGSRQVRVPPGEPAQQADAVAALLGEDDVAVVSADGPTSVCWELMRRAPAALVVLPPDPRVPRHVTEVLLPLDGAPDTAAAVAPMAQRLVDAGAHLRAMHVFDAGTAPAFWDQAAHSHEHWTEEFLLRNLPAAVELDLRRGRTCDEVVAEAERAGADLVMIGWAQDLGEGRARTVRRALDSGHVPVLLLPVPHRSDPGPSSAVVGPSTLDPVGDDRTG